VGDPDPYYYLADSIRAFLPSKILLEKMRSVGFQEVQEEVLVRDLVAIYCGAK